MSRMPRPCPRRGGGPIQKKDRRRRAGSGQVAGGKPATGRLCQAGLRNMKTGVRHPAYAVNKRPNRWFQLQSRGRAGYAARCPSAFRSARYRIGDDRLLRRTDSRPDTPPPRSIVKSGPSRRVGGLRKFGRAIAVSSSWLWATPVNRRSASRPRETLERIVPTGTSRTAATSP